MTENTKNVGDLVAITVTFAVTQALFSILDVPLGGTIATITSLAMAGWRLKGQGLGWSDLGLVRRYSLLRVIATAFVAAIAALVAGSAAGAFTTKFLGWPAVGYGHYGDLHGNLPRLALLLIIAWTTAGFGEEMLFRGFILTRLEGIMGKTRLALVLAVVGQAMLFGLAHFKQGPTGVLLTGVIGLVFGILYARERNLWPLIIAHGLMDTVSLIGLYANLK